MRNDKDSLEEAIALLKKRLGDINLTPGEKSQLNKIYASYRSKRYNMTREQRVARSNATKLYIQRSNEEMERKTEVSMDRFWTPVTI